MNTNNREIFLDDVRELLIKHTGGCAIQEDKRGNLWPCGTCVCALLGSVLDEGAPEYAEHNEPVDRINEVWRAILQMRDASTDEKVESTNPDDIPY